MPTPRSGPVLVCLSAILALTACHASGPAETPQAPAEPWYEPELRAFESADRASPPAPGQALFVGSSSIRLWSSLANDMTPVPVLNRGFGGSTTRDVLAAFDRTVTPYAPRLIVYYCGDNDLGADNTDSQSAADGFIAFDRRARALWPGVRVFYICIKPSIARWKNWPAMNRANMIVRAYCENTPGATYLDIALPSLTPRSTPDPALFEPDGLHLNPTGYALWLTIVGPPVLEAWKETKTPTTP